MGGPGKRFSAKASSSHGRSNEHVHSNEIQVPETIDNTKGDELTVVNSSTTTNIKRGENVQTCKSLGATVGINYETEDFCNRVIAETGGKDASRKGKRGRTRNLGLSKKKNAKEKLTIDIPENVNRIVGINSQFAITESGCLMRRFAPLQTTKWAKIDEDKKLGLLKDFKDTFNYGESERCDTAVVAQMKNQYRNYRHKLYKDYFLKGMVPSHVDLEDWKYLCNYFSSDEYQKISKRNKENRARFKDDAKHIAGTKSFARICREREEKKNDVVNQIELYRVTRCRFQDESDEGCWVSEGAKDNYSKMLELRNQKLVEGETPADEEQICGEVLGFKSGYIRGRGAGPKPMRSLSYQNYGLELEEAKRNAKVAQERAEKAEQHVMVIYKQLEKQQSITQELKEDLVATQKTMLENQRSTTEMMTFFDQFRRMNHFPAMSPWFAGTPNHNQHTMHGFTSHNLQNSNPNHNQHTTHGFTSQNLQNSNPNHNQHTMHGFTSQNLQNSNNEYDVFSGEPTMRELIQEVGRYPMCASFR